MKRTITKIKNNEKESKGKTEKKTMEKPMETKKGGAKIIKSERLKKMKNMKKLKKNIKK